MFYISLISKKSQKKNNLNKCSQWMKTMRETNSLFYRLSFYIVAIFDYIVAFQPVEFYNLHIGDIKKESSGLF